MCIWNGLLPNSGAIRGEGGQGLSASRPCGKLSFHVGRNEKLVEDLAAARARPAGELTGYFDLILGVKHFRYCHRLGRKQDCTADIYHLLRPGGVCIKLT